MSVRPDPREASPLLRLHLSVGTSQHERTDRVHTEERGRGSRGVQPGSTQNVVHAGQGHMTRLSQWLTIKDLSCDM